MSAQPAPRLSLAEFLHWEAAQPEKHEFYRGEVFAMTGARLAHGLVAINVSTLLRSHLRGKPCRAFASDAGVRLDASDAVFYPDVVVTCHPADLSAERWLRHPGVIVEVLSESTAAFDRGAKFAAYRTLDSLREYVLIDPDARSVDVFRRTDGGDWLLDGHAAEHGLLLPSLEFSAPLDAVFEDLPAHPPAAGTPGDGEPV